MSGDPVATTLVLGVATVGLFIYGCGPNIPCGAAQAIYHSAKGRAADVNKIALEKRLGEKSDEGERKQLADRIKEVNTRAEDRWDSARRHAISMIPIIGPFLACS